MVRKKLKKGTGAAELSQRTASDDASATVISWLEELQLMGHEGLPVVSPDLDVFGLLQEVPLPSPSAFSQARGVQALRAAVAKGLASREQLRLVFVVSLLLYIDPGTSLRKAFKGLLLAVERASEQIGDNTDDVVKLVATKFVEHAGKNDKPRSIARFCVSLQLLVNFDGGRRTLLGSLLFGRYIAALDLLLQAEAPTFQRMYGRNARQRVNGGAQTSEEKNPPGLGVAAMQKETELSAAMDNCGEILKAASCLLSLKEWDVGQLTCGDVTARRMCEVCLALLSIPTAHRELVTHASSVLVHLAMASWKACGKCPLDAAASGRGAADMQQGGKSRQLVVGASTIGASFFPEHAGEKHPSTTSGVSNLIISFMPLPPSSSLALCRALIHHVNPHLLLTTYGYEGGASSKGNLLVGPILRVILSQSGADSGPQLRFFSLQVLEAWCGRAKALAECGLALEDWAGSASTNDHDNGRAVDLQQSLSEIKDLTMAALVHPAKFISSMAPVLLEHVVWLRHATRERGVGVAGGDKKEWENLVERVLAQPASTKGKYVALAVLLPRVGALRLLELCPCLVEKLVWAVGVRGNVSGQATSLLLQLLKAIMTQLQGRSGAEGAVGPSAFSTSRGYWVSPAAAALMQEDLWSRSHVAAYLLPEVFKLDPGSVSELSAALRARNGHEGDEDPGGAEPEVRRMWAMMEVARLARKCGATAGLSTIAINPDEGAHGAPAGLLQLAEVEWAALHVDETLRMSALSMLCTDVRITTVPVEAETKLLQKVLPYSLKVFGAQSRQLLLRAVQTLLARMRETVRVCTKEIAALGTCGGNKSRVGVTTAPAKRSMEKRQGRLGGTSCESENVAAAPVDGVNQGTGGAETPAQARERVEDFVRWLCQELLQSLYPGCPFEREVLGLEIIQLMLSELLPPEESDGVNQRKHTLAKVLTSSLFCRNWVDTLLVLLGSSWDRSRSLAYAIIARFPRPLAGYEGLDGAAALAAEGLRLTGSGRQRESDKGALILRLVFVSYARSLGLGVPLIVPGVGAADGKEAAGGRSKGEGNTSEGGEGDAAARFLEELCAVVSCRLDGMQRSSDALLQHDAGAVSDVTTTRAEIYPFPHGVLLAVHHVLLESDLRKGAGAVVGRKRRGAKPRRSGEAGTISESVVDLDRRRVVTGLLLKQALRALRLSLRIVGEHGGAGDGKDGTSAVSATGVREVVAECEGGVVPARPPRSVNANGHMGMISVDSRGCPVLTTIRGRDGENASEASPDNMDTRGDKVMRGWRQADSMQGQRAVVGAWLLAKEACQCLATMVTVSLLPSAGGGAGKASTGSGESVSLLTREDVKAVGETLLESLLSLKHMGCVASAQTAFQAVCEGLLHSTGCDPALSCLPSIWLDKLLHQLEGTTKEFVLRRSTGLALAFMSILRAEPRSVAPMLLPHGMWHLLALAEPDQSHAAKAGGRLPSQTCFEGKTGSRGDWKSTVHALNVLRQVFIDAPLADDVGPYVAQAMTAAVCGFEDPVWAVRNSCMMLFASIMQRAVGGAKNAGFHVYSEGGKRPHSGKGSVTAEVFFQQHRELHPFLLSQLERAADNMSTTGSNASGEEPLEGRDGGAGRAEMHPVLYPILLLLARLRAGHGEVPRGHGEGERPPGAPPSKVSTAAFIPAVIRCGRNPHFLARAASARALAALVPPARSPGLIGELLGELPKSPTLAAFAGAGAHNNIHGTLLQVLELLLAARSSQGGGQVSTTSTVPDHDDQTPIPPDEHSGHTLDELATNGGETVLGLLWLVDPALSPCPPIRHAMLGVLRALVEARVGGDSFCGQVLSALQAAEETNFAEATRPEPAGQFVPGRSLLVSAVVDATVRRRLGGTLFGDPSGDSPVGESAAECEGGTSSAAEVAFVVELMCSADVDVRDAAIKATKKIFARANRLGALSSAQHPLLQIWAGAARALAGEVHPPNVRRLVRLLSRVGVHLHRRPLPVASEPLWGHLRGLCENSSIGSEDVHAGALEAMGTIIRLGEESVEGPSSAAGVTQYVKFLEFAADPEQALSMRAAAAASLASSGLLGGTPSSSTANEGCGRDTSGVSAHVRLWLVTLSLLQDDDENVRGCAARMCSAAAEDFPMGRNNGNYVESSRRGGRVGLRAVHLALARLAALAENRDGGPAAEQFSLKLLQVIAAMTGTSAQELSAIASSAGGGVGRLLQGHEELDGRSGGGDDDDEAIFGREDCNQFQEPPLFARAVAPYLYRALVALDAREGTFPQAVVSELASVLARLAGSLETFSASPDCLAGATWLPGVYREVVISTTVGGAVLEFAATRGDREYGHGNVAADFSNAVSRAMHACEQWRAVLGRDDRVHPGVSSAVNLAFRAAESQRAGGVL